MPGLALFGAEAEEEDLGEIKLWPRAEEEGWDGAKGEGGGPGPPWLYVTSSLCFFSLLSFFSFYCLRGGRVEDGDTPL